MRKSKRGGKTVYLDNVSIWWNEDTSQIHIRFEDKISTVSPDPSSERGNQHLFWKLAECLRDAGAPHPTRDNG